MRIASQSPFPYGWPGRIVCYFTHDEAGHLRQLEYRDDMRAHLSADDPPQLFAVWPGQYRSDLFVIDDLDALRAAVGMARDVRAGSDP